MSWVRRLRARWAYGVKARAAAQVQAVILAEPRRGEGGPQPVNPLPGVLWSSVVPDQAIVAAALADYYRQKRVEDSGGR